MLNILAIKAVPSVSWSSPHPLNLRPRLLTLLMLAIGLIILGVGEAMLVAAGEGNSPWTVLAEGLGLALGLNIGWATFVVSASVLLLWIPLRQTPGIGTLANAVIIAAAIGFSLPLLPNPEQYWLRIAEAVVGILLVGLGSGLYLMAHLGAGPRDGLMTGLQRLSGLPIASVRTAIELTAVAIGWLLGGTVGMSTLLFALGIGAAVSLGLAVVQYCSPANRWS